MFKDQIILTLQLCNFGRYTTVKADLAVYWLSGTDIDKQSHKLKLKRYFKLGKAPGEEND